MTTPSISKTDAIIYLVLIVLGIVFGANFLRTTIVLQPINQTIIQQKVVEVRIKLGDNLIITNGTNVIRYEDGNLTTYWSGPRGIMTYFEFNVSYGLWSYHQLWAYTSVTQVNTLTGETIPYSHYTGVVIKFEIPNKGKYESWEITDTNIIFRRVK